MTTGGVTLAALAVFLVAILIAALYVAMTIVAPLAQSALTLPLP